MWPSIATPTLRFAAALLGTSIKASMAQRGTFLLQAGLMILNNLILFVFWWLLFGRVAQIRGYRLPEMAVLYGVVVAGYGVGVTAFGGVRHLGRFIHEGELDALMAQPKPTLLYVLGSRSQASGIGDVVSGSLLIALSGRVSPGAWPLVIIAIGASSLVFVASGTIYGSLAFWLGRVDGVARQLWEALITFSLYPDALFRGPLRVLLFTLIPAGFVGYLPAQLIRDPSVLTAALTLVGALGYAGVAVAVFGRGLRRYCGGSRFGTLG